MHNGLLELLLLAQHKADSRQALHCKRVACYALELAKEINENAEFRKKIFLSGLLHDIGFLRLEIPFSEMPLHKADPNFVEIIQSHSVMGEQLIGKVINDPEILSTIRHHHEQFNGEGYPDHLVGEEIPLAARILAVADYYDSLLVGESFGEHRRTPRDVVLHLEQDAKGTYLDPNLVEVFLKLLDKIPVLFLPYKDNELKLYQMSYLHSGPLEAGDLINQDGHVLLRQGIELDQKMLDNIRLEYPGQKIIEANPLNDIPSD
jgi:putative nucleotidyltransferase with HDIG domain